MNKDLGERDVRKIEDKDIIKEIQEVLAEVKEYDDSKNGSKCHGVLRIGLKQTELLEKMLSERWNKNLGEIVKETCETEDWKFHKASPLKSKSVFECEAPGCNAVYSNGMAYKKHLRSKNHGDPKQVVLPMVTCRLPHSKGTRAKEKHTMDQIGTHLYNVSNITLIKKTFSISHLGS